MHVVTLARTHVAVTWILHHVVRGLTGRSPSIPLLQLGRVFVVNLLSQNLQIKQLSTKSQSNFNIQYLQTLQRVVTVGGVDFVEVDAGALHLGVGAEGQLAQALELHDVHLGAQVLGQVAVDAKGDFAIFTLEWSGVVRRWHSKS